MTDHQAKNIRTLEMYQSLCEGKVINKAQEAQRFGVDERSIQRDIDDIRAFLDERSVADARDTRKVLYSREKKGFYMTGNEATLMENSEILAVSKILLASRAFSKKDISMILDKMILGCVPQKNMKLVSELISNEKHHYVELQHRGRKIKELLWDLGEEIKACNLLEIDYQRQINTRTRITRVIQPVAVLFSEYYFYLNAYIVERNERGDWEQKYDYPTIFRLDRIRSFREMGERFQIPYRSRFEEGQFRKCIQFMQAGELMRCQFRFSGNSVEAVLDRLPTAKVIKEEEGSIIMEAQVYGKGILMWFLSQGSLVEVLKPDSLREEMKRTLQEMLEAYEAP